MRRGPAPQERSFGFLDHLALWGSLGITLYVMPFGSLLVPALSLEEAFGAVAVAALLGSLIIAAVVAIAARSGLTTVGLLEDLFGRRTAALPAALVLARNVVWAAFALSLIADSAELVSDRTLGAGLRPLWVVAFGLVGLYLTAAGPQFTVRQLLRKAGLWIAIVVAGVITLSAYLEFRVPTYLERPPVGGWPAFWQAVDVMLVVPLLWLPLAADYGRLGRGTASALGGTFLGLFAATFWLGTLGVLYLPAVETGDIAGFVLAMRVGLAALAILLFLQADEVFANMHSAGLALSALLPIGRRGAYLAPSLAAILVTLPFDFMEFEGSLLLLASLFIPLFGVLLAHHLLGRPPATPWSVPSVLLAWALGFLLYHWISPSEVGWWQDAMSWLWDDSLHLPFPLTEERTWLGAAIPSFLAALLTYLLALPALSRLEAHLRADEVSA